MYDTAFHYNAASNVSVAWGKVNEQLYNDILKEETLPYCIHCHAYGHRTLGCPTRSKPPQPFHPSRASFTTSFSDTFDHFDAVSTALAKEVSNSHTAEPFPSPPIFNLQCSPLGVVPNKDGTWRLIMDPSSPHGSSINDYISKEGFTLHYATFDQAISLGAHHEMDALMAKLDIKHAFRLW